MRIYRKEGGVVQILSFPGEEAEIGDYLIIDEPLSGRALIVQVVDTQFANVPGILEEFLRDAISEGAAVRSDLDPYEISTQMAIIKDAKLLICRIRGTIKDGKIATGFPWLPSRVNSKIAPFPVEAVLEANSLSRPIELGFTRAGKPVKIDAAALDGKLTIITGKKGTGKSHLAKLLLLGLIDYGAPCLVFDINGEYVSLSKNRGGSKSKYGEKLMVLEPGFSLVFKLKEIRLSTFINIMLYSLDLPPTSARVLANIWRWLEARGELSLSSLGEAIARHDCHESVREALTARFHTLLQSGLFDDDLEYDIVKEAMDFLSSGGTLVVDMSNMSSMNRRIAVELLLSKLSEDLLSGGLKAVFLFAEEAHLYLRETYWDDIVTRMRHLGLFAILITNQPDSISERIYRQADNIFLFNFTNDRDLEFVSRASRIDADSVKVMVRELPPRFCMAIGDVVRDFPLIVAVKPLEVLTLGETRLFFEQAMRG